MQKGKAIVKNDPGINGRAAKHIADASKEYQSRIVVRYNDMELSTKEVLDLLKVSLSQGCEVEVEAEGPDEKEAIDTISNLLESNHDYC